jgi:hypothetical protein
MGVLILAAWAGAAAAAVAVAPEVRDHGKFFGPEAVKKADDQIREIYRKHNLDLMIEAFAALPPERAEKARELEGKARDEFFTEWAKERAEARVVNGISILICREPKILRVGRVGRGEKAFTAAFRTKLYDAIRTDLGASRFDDVLRKAVKMVEEHLAKSADN